MEILNRLLLGGLDAGDLLLEGDKVRCEMVQDFILDILDQLGLVQRRRLSRESLGHCFQLFFVLFLLGGPDFLHVKRVVLPLVV